jgi:hypothetical protein
MGKLLKLKSGKETEERVGGGGGKLGEMFLGLGLIHFFKKKGWELLSLAAAMRVHIHGSWISVWARLEEEERNLTTQECSE